MQVGCASLRSLDEDSKLADQSENVCPEDSQGFEGECWMALNGGCLFPENPSGVCYRECLPHHRLVTIYRDGEEPEVRALGSVNVDGYIRSYNEQNLTHYTDYCDVYRLDNPGEDCLISEPQLLLEAKNKARSGVNQYAEQWEHQFSTCGKAKESWKQIENFHGCLLKNEVGCEILSCNEYDAPTFIGDESNPKEVRFMEPNSVLGNRGGEPIPEQEFIDRFGTTCSNLKSLKESSGGPVTRNDIDPIESLASTPEVIRDSIHGAPGAEQSGLESPPFELWESAELIPVTLSVPVEASGCHIGFDFEEVEAWASVVRDSSGTWLSIVPYSYFPSLGDFNLEHVLPHELFIVQSTFIKIPRKHVGILCTK